MKKNKTIKIVGLVLILLGILLFGWALSKMVISTFNGGKLSLFWWQDLNSLIFFVSLVFLGIGVQCVGGFNKQVVQSTNRSKFFQMSDILLLGGIICVSLYLVTDGFSSGWTLQDYWWAIKNLFSLYH